MNPTRRQLLASGACLLVGGAHAEPARASSPAMGVVIHSYSLHRASDRVRFDDPLAFLEFCKARGAGGVQTALGRRADAASDKVRAYLEEHKLYLEGSIALPRETADLERFKAEVRTAKRCGADTFRTVLLNGRRYETFKSAEAYRTFLEQGREALARARPVVEKAEVRMAIENHKDLQAAELLDLVRKMDSPFVGVCLDTGNNLALLEAPEKTAELLAPHAFTTHVKDMGVEEYPEGFLLAEVPLGAGFLDLGRIVAALRRARPGVRLNLEMITRDPLKVPCLTPGYWPTLENVPGRQLAEMLALVRAKAGSKLPRISDLGRDEQLRREDDNVKQSLRHAREKLAG